MISEVALRQPYGPLEQRLVRVLTALPGRQPGDHPVHPLALLGPGELRRDQDDDPLAVPVRGDRTAALGAAPYLDRRLSQVGGHAVAVLVTHDRDRIRRLVTSQGPRWCVGWCMWGFMVV